MVRIGQGAAAITTGGALAEVEKDRGSAKDTASRLAAAERAAARCASA